MGRILRPQASNGLHRTVTADDAAQQLEARLRRGHEAGEPAAIEVSDTLWLMGRDRDEHGRVIPGARVIDTYNLIERGLAWRKGIAATQEFVEMTREIVARFATL